jgi:hypothetical protein
MRRIVLVALALAASACARARVTQVDYQARTFVVCGNKWTDGNDLMQKAREQCSANPRVLRCGEHAYATVAQVYGNTATARDVTGLCCQYQCH